MGRDGAAQDLHCPVDGLSYVLGIARGADAAAGQTAAQARRSACGLRCFEAARRRAALCRANPRSAGRAACGACGPQEALLPAARCPVGALLALAPAHAHNVAHGRHGQRIGHGLVERRAAGGRQQPARQQGALQPEQREAVVLIHCRPMVAQRGFGTQSRDTRRGANVTAVQQLWAPWPSPSAQHPSKPETHTGSMGAGRKHAGLPSGAGGGPGPCALPCQQGRGGRLPQPTLGRAAQGGRLAEASGVAGAGRAAL